MHIFTLHRYKLFYSGLSFSVCWLGAGVSAMCLVLSRESSGGCVVTNDPTAQNAFFILSIIALVVSVLWALSLPLYFLIKWREIWLQEVAIPAREHRLYEDVEDEDPGILGRSGTRSFLKATESTIQTKREVAAGIRDLEA